MDPNSNTHRHQSRLKREMYASRLNPFNSPPSSTGSHGTVSTTTVDLTTHNLSTFSFSPDGEGTRKFSEDLKEPSRRPSAARSGRFGTRPSTIVNTSALARTFPEWSSLASTLPTQEVNPAPMADDEGKENVPPPYEDTAPIDDILDLKQKRTRADMQPRVETASDCSTVLSQTSIGPFKASRRSRFAKAQVNTASGSSKEPARQAVSDLLVSKIRAAQASGERRPTSHPPTSKYAPPASSERAAEHNHPSLNAVATKHASSPFMNRSGMSATGRSFLLPSLHNNIFDWTSGTLKFSTMRNGVPVFVKHGKARSRFQQAVNEHDTVDAIDIPEEDQEIFVSMDKLREEVKDLQDHDEMVQQEAEKLQSEVNQLQSELKRLRVRKRSDSAIGSDSDQSINKALDAQKNKYDEKIARLQERLEQASRLVGVNDIHSAALTAERDEALHQASMARERAKRYQAELESSQKDLELSFKYRLEKETLEQENTSLRAANDTLSRQHDDLVASNKSLNAQHAKLGRDFEAAQRELDSVREELHNIHVEYEILSEQNAMISQDHASLERNNETYFKENKSLRTKIASQDQRIHDLEKGIANRDEMIDALQADVTRTTEGAGLRDQYTQLETEIERLKQRLQNQESELRKKDEAIAAMREENLTLAQENERLNTEGKQKEDQWVSDRHKNIRLSQALMKNETRYLKHINDHNEECERREAQCKQKEAALARKEATLTQQFERRNAAIKKAKQLTMEITNLSLSRDISAKAAKVTRIVEPTRSSQYAGSEQSAKSDALNVEDDPTTRIDPTLSSDFASIFTDDEIPRLKETLRYLREGQQQQQSVEEASAAGNTVHTIDSDLPPLPGPAMRRTKSDETIIHKQSKPAGILKKTGHFVQEDDFTGRFSVKSGISLVSLQSNQSDRTAQSQKSAKSLVSVQGSRPDSHPHRRTKSDNARFDTEFSTEHNMTSAFFVPDITLHGEEHITAEQSGPSLSKDARRVLDGVCNHKSRNCTVCTRISAHAKSTSTTSESSGKKKTVRVQKPIPVTDRMPEPGPYEDEPTMRPSMAPGHALAIVIKEMEDEIAHLEMELLNKNRLYCSLDKSLGQRDRKRVMAQIQQLHRELESKSSIMYKLHDVLEGQKVAGQAMTEAELEVTIASICGLDVTSESKDASWNGCD